MVPADKGGVGVVDHQEEAVAAAQAGETLGRGWGGARWGVGLWVCDCEVSGAGAGAAERSGVRRRGVG